MQSLRILRRSAWRTVFLDTSDLDMELLAFPEHPKKLLRPVKLKNRQIRITDVFSVAILFSCESVGVPFLRPV